MSAPQILFLVLSALGLLAAMGTVSAKNLVHAALLLVAFFLVVACQFVLLDAEFLAVIQVLIYIGAVAILLMFGIMLTRNVLGDETTRGSWLSTIPAAIASVAVLVVLVVGVGDRFSGASRADRVLADFGIPAEQRGLSERFDADPITPMPSAAEFVQVYGDLGGAEVSQMQLDGVDTVGDAVAMMSSRPAAPEDDPRGAAIRDMARSVGREMMTRYAIAFEAAGLLLTAALVGAVVVARLDHDPKTDETPRRGPVVGASPPSAGMTSAGGGVRGIPPEGRPR